MLFIARRHFVRRDHRQSRRGEGKNEKQRCEKAKVLVPPAHSIPPVDLLFSVRAPPSYANSPQRFRGGGGGERPLPPLAEGWVVARQGPDDRSNDPPYGSISSSRSRTPRGRQAHP